MSSETSELTQHDLDVIESIHASPKAMSQRELAKQTGLSVGLINAIIKKLVKTGYVKTSHLNKRSLEYLLTPDGFTQAALKSYRYVMNTVKSYRVIHERLHGLVAKLSGEGVTEFYLYGDGELSELVAVFFEEEGLGALKRSLPNPKDGGKSAVVLNAQPQSIDCANLRVVNLVHVLGNGTKGLGIRD